MILIILVCLPIGVSAGLLSTKETRMYCQTHSYKLEWGLFNKKILIKDKDEWVGWCTEDRQPSGKLTLDETSAECEREDGITIRLDFENNKRSLSFPVTPKAFYQKSFTCS